MRQIFQETAGALRCLDSGMAIVGLGMSRAPAASIFSTHLDEKKINHPNHAGKYVAMKIAVNVGELKNRLSEYLERVQNGDEIEVCKRNIPFATITGKPLRKNRSQLGWAIDTTTILYPIIPEEDWKM